jgi:hypothetical protein
MSRQLAIAAFAAALAASPMLVSPAEAQTARRGNALAIGLAAGVGGLLIGSAIANAQPRHAPAYHGQPRYYGEPTYRVRPRYVHDVGYGGGHFHREPDCVRQPIQRVDRFTGEVFIAGTRIVCR